MGAVFCVAQKRTSLVVGCRIAVRSGVSAEAVILHPYPVAAVTADGEVAVRRIDHVHRKLEDRQVRLDCFWCPTLDRLRPVRWPGIILTPVWSGVATALAASIARTSTNESHALFSVERKASAGVKPMSNPQQEAVRLDYAGSVNSMSNAGIFTWSPDTRALRVQVVTYNRRVASIRAI